MQVRVLILLTVLFEAGCVTRPEHSPAYHTPQWVVGGPVAYLPRGRYESEVTLERLRKTPRWTRSSSWPPLSPRDAERIAATVFLSLNPSEGLSDAKWTRERI